MHVAERGTHPKPRKTYEIGTRIGKWTVRSEAPQNRHHMSQSVCECDCGRFDVIINANLREGKTTQCRKCAMAEKLGMQKNGGGKKLDAEKVTDIRIRLRRGETPYDIALVYDVSKLMIYQIDRGKSWKDVPWPTGTGPRQQRAGGAHLTHEKVKAIKVDLAAKMQGRFIAKKHGVSPNTVSSIKRRHCWNSVPWPEGYND